MTRRIHPSLKTDLTAPAIELRLQIERAMPRSSDETWRHQAARNALLECVSTLASLCHDSPRLTEHIDRILASVLLLIQQADDRDRLQRAIELVSMGVDIDMSGLCDEIIRRKDPAAFQAEYQNEPSEASE